MESPFKTTEPHIEEAQLSPCRKDDGLYNDQVRVLRWKNISATMRGGRKGASKVLLQSVSGSASAGELIAIMGPSGSGKTTLLNQLAQRTAGKLSRSGSIFINDTPANAVNTRETSSYVEQEDHLIGAITSAETLAFAAKLSLTENLSKSQLNDRIDAILSALGLSGQASVIVGTPIQKGLSGGQKRRVSVASQLITSPKILFLDEPTSGLDSVAAYEVVSYLRKVTKENNLIVIASIHQPSTSTFNLFDKVHLLAKGQLCYAGPIVDVASHFLSLGFKLPKYTNPAEWLLELVDTDFSPDQAAGRARLHRITLGWDAAVRHDQSSSTAFAGTDLYLPLSQSRIKYTRSFTLVHRMWLKSYRDILAYWIRVAMYTCLAILMGTCWLRLGLSQDDIQPRITSIFFGGAFLSFMAVAYIPAYMEDQAIFFKEQANGLYGPTEFLIANFLIGLPYILGISLLFSVIAYWLVNLWPTARGFWTFVAFLFLDMLAAESLVVLVSSILPNFIVALAITAFANGLWMCVNGFLVPETVLNVFWRSWVTKIDYQNWVFRAMIWNEFHAQDFTCAEKGVCAFPSATDGLTIPGKSVLAYYGYHSGPLGSFAGYIVAIIVVYRLLAWGVLMWRR